MRAGGPAFTRITNPRTSFMGKCAVNHSTPMHCSGLVVILAEVAGLH